MELHQSSILIMKIDNNFSWFIKLDFKGNKDGKRFYTNIPRDREE